MLHGLAHFLFDTEAPWRVCISGASADLAELRCDAFASGLLIPLDSNKEGLLDLRDVTKVKVANGRVVRIGKELSEWDTGVFYCTQALFEGIRRAATKGHHGLSDAIRELAVEGRVRPIDVTGEQWTDMDNAFAFRHAQRRLLASVVKNTDDGYVSQHLNRRLSLGEALSSLNVCSA